MKNVIKILLKLKNLDRRWVYLVVALAVMLPMLFNFNLPIYPGKPVKNLYNFIDKLEPGTRCFLSFDFDPAAEPELGPGAVAVLIHMFKKDLKPICGANWPVGADLADAALNTAKQTYEAQYNDWKSEGKIAKSCKPMLHSGEDYVNVGYKTGGIIHVKAMCNDFMYPFPQDKDGNSTANMKIFANPDGKRFSMDNIGLIISFSAGTNGLEAFISMAGEHKRPMATGCTSVNIPRYTTFMQSKQIVGMIGGLPGAAEYETLVEVPANGCKGMTPQSAAHLVIMLFIILGNLAYFAEKKVNAKRK